MNIALVGLLNECQHSASITLCVSASCPSDHDFDGTFLEMVLSVLAHCAEVNELVKKGVLIIILERPASHSTNG